MESMIFKYEGVFEDISWETVILTQNLYFNIMRDINKSIYPDEKFELKLRNLAKGSIILEFLKNAGEKLIVDSIYKGSTKALGYILKYIKYLCKNNKKHTEEEAKSYTDSLTEDKDMKNIILINLKNSKLVINISDLVKKLEVDEAVDGFVISDKKEEEIAVDRSDFESYSNFKSYLPLNNEKEEKIEVQNNLKLKIKKAPMEI
jgi:hypothetical protein